MNRLAPTSAGWLHTCSKSGTMRPTPTWAGSSLRLRAAGRPGGWAAYVRRGSRTGSKRLYNTAQMAADAPTILAKQSVPAMIWPTTTQRWQRSGTGRPMGRGHQRLSLHAAAAAEQSGGVASVGMDGALLCQTEQMEEDALSVRMRPAVTSHASPASGMERHTCWLSGTGKLIRHTTGAQTKPRWARRGKCTG